MIYVPKIGELIDCSQCEVEDCHSRYKFQRNLRHFSYLSGRCPKLPDVHGNVEPEYRNLYDGSMKQETGWRDTATLKDGGSDG